MKEDLFKLTGKIAVVTGGSKGIGRAIVELFCKQGAVVHFFDIDDEEGNKVLHNVLESDGKAHYHHCDVSSFDEVEEAFEKVWSISGQLDILVNNAAVSSIGKVEDTTSDEMDRIYQMNIKSVYNCLFQGVKKMKSSGGGAIVNMASIVSVVGIPDRFAYSMSKGAVYTMTFSLAKDYLKDNIRCNAVGPARVHTPFVDGYISKNFPGKEQEMFDDLSKTQPIGRMAKPLEIAQLVTYLCSDESSFVTGSFYPIDGGFITLNS